MNGNARPKAYSRLQIFLHWSIALLIGVNYVLSDGIEDAFDGMMEGQPVTDWTASAHVWIGVAVLVLVVFRLLARLVQGAPEAAAGSNRLMDRAAGLVHLGLYGLMIAVPALGAITWFGATEATADLHVITMNVMMAVIGVHAAAAIFHQFVLKDGLLRRMTRAS